MQKINAILTSKGTVVQHIEETEKSLKLIETLPSGLIRLIARYNKTNRWVSYEGNPFMTLL